MTEAAQILESKIRKISPSSQPAQKNTKKPEILQKEQNKMMKSTYNYQNTF